MTVRWAVIGYLLALIIGCASRGDLRTYVHACQDVISLMEHLQCLVGDEDDR